MTATVKPTFFEEREDGEGNDESYNQRKKPLKKIRWGQEFYGIKNEG